MEENQDLKRMVHDLNNAMAGILQSVQIIQNRLSADLPANEAVAVEVGIDRTKMKEYLEKRKIPDLFEKISLAGKNATGIIKNIRQHGW